MKTSIILIIAATVTPAAITIGLSAAAAASIVTAVGLASIALSDYGEKATYVTDSNRVAVKAAQAERLPLAA